MKIIRQIALYMALALGANPALSSDIATLEALREGDMKKLVFHSEPRPASTQSYELADGGTGALSDYKGRIILLNFWATWCAPCRHEMPMLSDLQAELGSDQFSVVTLATGRNPLPAIAKFFDEIGVDNLPKHRDPKQALGREMGIFGLPITVILDRNGHEIARLQGDADWSSDSAKTILQALIDTE